MRCLKIFCAVIAFFAVASGSIFDTELIVDGNSPETKHPFPHLVGLLLTVPSNLTLCGGSLISDRYVLTAAHCVKGATKVEIVLGAFNITDRNEPSQIRFVVDNSTITIHERFTPIITRADVALIKLPKSVVFNEYIQPVKLPNAKSLLHDYVGTKLLIMGWGATTYHSLNFSSTLNYAKMPVIQRNDCGGQFSYILSQAHLCARSKDHITTCIGDDGAPVMYEEPDGAIVQLGIVAFGWDVRCKANWPAIFMRVDNFLKWISNHTGIPVDLNFH